jgi:enoyl-CoA hydratase/carnithine racemase
LAADLRVAKKGGGKMGLPEVNLGVLPGTGGTQRLSRALGRARSFELMATGRTFSFEDGKQLGLVHELFEAGEFDEKVREYAAQFLPPSRASKAVGLIKRAVVSGLAAGFAEGMALERELQQRLFESEDAREGLAAYLERRPAKFTGR